MVHSPVDGRTSTRSSVQLIGSASVGQVVLTQSAGVAWSRALIQVEVVNDHGKQSPGVGTSSFAPETGKRCQFAQHEITLVHAYSVFFLPQGCALALVHSLTLVR